MGKIRRDIYIHSGILAIKKNEILQFAATWMDLEGIMLISKSEEPSNMKFHVYRIQKKTKQMNKRNKTEIVIDTEIHGVPEGEEGKIGEED